MSYTLLANLIEIDKKNVWWVSSENSPGPKTLAVAECRPNAMHFFGIVYSKFFKIFV